MKSIKSIFTIIVSIIILLGISSKSKAITLSTAETPASVESESEFSIVLKFDEKVTGFNAHIAYDPDLFTISSETDDPNLSINPAASKKGDLAMVYAPFSSTISQDTFKIKVKVANVTAEKTAKFTISNIDIVAQSSTIGETLDNKDMSITIKPVEETPKVNENKIENTQYKGKELAKTGESELILLVVVVLIISAIVIRIKSKKVM
ncbi:MAG: hypothetical protein J6K42_00970 [Clostridia bacterium]|nr:hypothetical protein [Clostridia bacterium]